MDKKDVLAALMFYRNIDGEIRYYRGMVEELESYYDTIGGQSLDGMPKGKNHISNAVEAVALNLPDGIAENIDYYTAKIAELQTLKVEILREISGLEYKLKVIVTDYYLHGLKWEQVSARNHYSERQCKISVTRRLEAWLKRSGQTRLLRVFRFQSKDCPPLPVFVCYTIAEQGREKPLKSAPYSNRL